MGIHVYNTNFFKFMFLEREREREREQAEWIRKVKMRRGEIPGSRRSIPGYILALMEHL